MRFKLPMLPFVQSMAERIDRWFPFISMRLAAALKAGDDGDQALVHETKQWWAHHINIGLILGLAAAAVTFVMRDAVWVWIGFAAFIGYPLIRYRSMIGLLERYREQIAYDLPEFVQVLVIYLYAGYTVSTALRSMAARWKGRNGPLPSLVQEAAAKLTYQLSLSLVLHQLSAKADTNDIKSVINILLTHTTRGGEATIDTLLDISRQMWSKRMSLVRRRAEETTVKLIFPLVAIFVAILLIVGAPAVMFMNG